MQLFKIVTRHSPGEGDDYTSIRTVGKRCEVVEKVIGKGAKTHDTDANGAGYLIRRLLDERAKMTQRELGDLRLHGAWADAEVHPALQKIMDDNARSVHSPMLAKAIWDMTHSKEAA